MTNDQREGFHDDVLNSIENDDTTGIMGYQQILTLAKEWLASQPSYPKSSPRRGGGRTGGGSSLAQNARQAAKQRGDDPDTYHGY